jgi:uncharacterized protein YggE
MKRLLLLALLFSLPAFGAEEPRSIEVSGEGVVKAEPDQVTLQFGIESNDRDIVKAKDDNAQKTKKLLDALKKFNIPSKDIQTGYIQINPRYDYTNGRQVFNGYVAMKQLSVTLRDLNEYGKVLNAVIEAGVDHVNGLQFEHSKANELKMEARKRAVADAKTKAELLAGELKQKVGQPLLIQESDVPTAVPMFRGDFRAMAMKGAAAEDTISPGETTVRATVVVRFQLQ